MRHSLTFLRRLLSAFALAILTLLPSSALGAFAAVQTATQVSGTASTTVVTLGAAATAGNLLVVAAAVNSSTVTCTGITDSAGNTWAVIGPETNGTSRVYLGYAVQVTGGATTVTVSWSDSAATKRAGVDEYSGGASTNAAIFDVSTTGQGTGTALAVSTLTPASTGTLIVAVAASSTRTYTAGSGYTLYSGGAGSGTLKSQYNLSSAATETAPFTLSSSSAWEEIAASFLPAGAATATPTPTHTPTVTPTFTPTPTPTVTPTPTATPTITPTPTPTFTPNSGFFHFFKR